MAFFVEVRKNGKVYGKLGPYAKKSAALLDAAALKRPNLTTAVVGAPSRSGSSGGRTRKNNPVAARMALEYLGPLALQIAKNQAQKFMAADQEGRIQMIRQFSKTQPALYFMLQNDKNAARAADMLASMLSKLNTPEGSALVDAGIKAIITPAGPKK